MDLKRFFTEQPIEGDFVALTGDEFYHAVKVTRHKVGYQLILCDQSNYDFYATIRTIEKDRLFAEVTKKIKNQTENHADITLYIGMNKDIDAVVQKATELGIKRVVPFYSQHSGRENISLDRMRRIVLESAKQCGRSRLTEVADLMDFKNAIDVSLDTKSILFYEYAECGKVSEIVAAATEKISFFIGAEGGFSSDEIIYAKEKGVTICTLGRRILRVSTAAVAAATLILEALGEL